MNLYRTFLLSINAIILVIKLFWQLHMVENTEYCLVGESWPKSLTGGFDIPEL